MLQEALARWQGFNERLKEFTDWLMETEDTLAGMRTINVSDINQVVEHVQCLKVCDVNVTKTFVDSSIIEQIIRDIILDKWQCQLIGLDFGGGQPEQVPQ